MSLCWLCEYTGSCKINTTTNIVFHFISCQRKSCLTYRVDSAAVSALISLFDLYFIVDFMEYIPLGMVLKFTKVLKLTKL